MRVSEHFKKIIIALGILGIVIVIGFSVFFVCFIKDLKGAKAPLFGENALSKEETFQILIQNQDEFEKVVDDMQDLLKEKGDTAISLRGKSEYRLNGIKSGLFKKYPIKMISISNINEAMEITFNFEVESDSVLGIYYVLDDEPAFWGEKQNIKEENGIYIKQGPYYLYKTEKITTHWYYFEVEMW